MSKAPVWLKKVSEEIIQNLSDRYYRPISVNYGGPYIQDGKKIVEAFYNDIILNQLKSKNPYIKHSARFGFRIRRLYDFNDKTYKVWVGFDMNNKILAMNSFIRGMRVHRKDVATQMDQWLQKQTKISWLWFAQGAKSYIWDPKHSSNKIKKELQHYGINSLPLSEIRIDTDGEVEGTEFTIERELKKFRGLSEKQLKEEIESLSKASLKVFKELNFLYYHLFTINLRK